MFHCRIRKDFTFRNLVLYLSYPSFQKGNCGKGTVKNLYYSNRSNYSTNSLNNKDYNNTLNKSATVWTARHYPPAVREWKNSVYNFNKNSSNDLVPLYNKTTDIINSYFNLHNNNNLARSKRMRYLRIKSTSKRLYISKPELKQTNDKVTITVYYFDKIKHHFLRKNFFFNRPNIVNYILDQRYKERFVITHTKFLNKRIKHSGIKQIKELKSFKEKNLFKNKYIEQTIKLHFFKYVLSLLGIYLYTPIQFYKNIINRDELELIIEKEKIKINKIIQKKPKWVFWINYNNFSLDIIDGEKTQYNNLMTKMIDHYDYMIKDNSDYNITLDNVNEINKKISQIMKSLFTNNTLSNLIFSKIYNLIGLNFNKDIRKNLYHKQHRKISKLTRLSAVNQLKFKEILPALKMILDTLYNKKIELNMVNLKYFYLNSDIYAKAVITKMKKKTNPSIIIKKSLTNVKVHLKHDIERKIMLNYIHKLYMDSSLPLYNFPLRYIKSNVQQKFKLNKDWLQKVLQKLYPYNLLYKYLGNKLEKNKITNVLNNIKYKSVTGLRVEAKGRLTRRNKAARSVSFLNYKGNRKDDQIFYNDKINLLSTKPALLLRNDVKANTQYTYKGSIRRIGAFGIKAWLSAK